MDDNGEKSIVEKISEAVKDIVDTASAAAIKAMQVQPDPEQVAGTANEQVYIPEATDAAAMPAPLMASKPVAKRKTTAKLTVAQTPPRKAAAKTSSQKAARKTVKKTVKKSSGKSAKKTAKKLSATNNIANKVAKK